MQAEHLLPPRFSSRRANFAVSRTLFATLTLAWLCLNVGCSVTGFRPIPDGPTTPGQLRAGAAVARAEANALDAIADQQEGVIRETLGAATAIADAAGAGPFAGLALGGLAGWLVPTPNQRRRERLAAAEAKSTTPPTPGAST